MPWDEKDEQGQGGSFEYDFAIASSKAGYTEYNEGKTCMLILEGEKTFSNGRVVDDHMWVKVPDGWTCDAEGRFFVNEEDADARFDKRSKIQVFITSAIKAGVPLKERSENSLDASGWAGLKLKIREEERSFKSRENNETVTYPQPVVVEYLGEVGGTSPSKAPEKKAASNGGGSDDEVKAKARVIAKGQDSLVDYMDTVSRELKVPLDHEVCSSAFYEEARA